MKTEGGPQQKFFPGPTAAVSGPAFTTWLANYHVAHIYFILSRLFDLSKSVEKAPTPMRGTTVKVSWASNVIALFCHEIFAI